LRIERGVEFDLKTFVARSNFGIAPWNGEIKSRSAVNGQFHHAEGAANQVCSSPPRQCFDKLFIAQPESFDVEIFAGTSEKRVANATADEIRLCEFRRFRQDLFERWRN